jgi:hypothetical protein
MSKVITFSRVFPSYHPRAGEPTYFVEKVWNGLPLKDRIVVHPDVLRSLKMDLDALLSSQKKHHTIRAGHRFKAGDWFSPRVWGNDVNPKSGKSGPYHSKQITFAPDIQVKKVWDFKIISGSICISDWTMSGELEMHHEQLELIASNDGLTKDDFLAWFQYPNPFDGQIISWNESINY